MAKRITRMEMLEKARKLAHDQIEGSSALNDAEYARLRVHSEEKAIKILAIGFLEDGAVDLAHSAD